MTSHANLLAQRSTWDQLTSLHGQPQLSSFFVFDKHLGRPLGQCVNWTHVRSRVRRKLKWRIGGCGALRRCGCAWTDKGTQFHCVKFRLGSAGEPTICSHCYDVLNEDTIYTADWSQWTHHLQIYNVMKTHFRGSPGVVKHSTRLTRKLTRYFGLTLHFFFLDSHLFFFINLWFFLISYFFILLS